MPLDTMAKWDKVVAEDEASEVFEHSCHAKSVHRVHGSDCDRDHNNPLFTGTATAPAVELGALASPRPGRLCLGVGGGAEAGVCGAALVILVSIVEYEMRAKRGSICKL